MTSNDTLGTEFDDTFGGKSSPVPLPEPQTDESWPSKSRVKKSKKNSKAKKNASVSTPKAEDEEDTIFAQPITPSPPADHGVRLMSATPPMHLEPAFSALDTLAIDLEEDTAVTEEYKLAEVDSISKLQGKALHMIDPPTSAPHSPRHANAEPFSPNISPRPRLSRPVPASGPTTIAPPFRPVPHGVSQSPPGTGLRRPSSGHAFSPRPRLNPPHNQPSQQSRFYEPPPPHLPQTHFFGLPDLGLNLMSKSEPGKVVGSDGNCCCFDSFSDSGDGIAAKRAKDALLVGFDNGIDVYRVLADKLEIVGRLEGLRGAVIGAKIIPCPQRQDPWRELRPLVALLIHGAMDGSRADSGQDEDEARDVLGKYQTSVEVYSLQTQEHMATLYKSPPVTIQPPIPGQLSLPPSPVGELSLDASGSFITVASGKTGEVFVFTNAPISESTEFHYRCVGKYWTSLLLPQDAGRPHNPGDSEVHDQSKRARTPILSLSPRWLAIVPPYTTAGISLQGSPLLSTSNPNPPGLNTHVAPVQPLISCEVAGIDEEGTFSWLSRKAAQGLVKASQKGYEMGIQGWKELTQPIPVTAQPAQTNRSSGDYETFPPTNATAEDPRRLAKEPALVSIIDLQRSLEAEEWRPKHAAPPLATFALIDGCKYLSFSPDGLRLLTTDRNGEVSTTWDLKNIAYTHIREDIDDDEGNVQTGPHVRQLLRIPRSSSSIVLESAWTSEGDWVALLTAHGTIHLHEIPHSLPHRRRKRRSTASRSTADKAEAIVGVTEGVSPPSSSGIWNSVRTGWQSVSTQVSALRSQNSTANFNVPTTFAGFREVTAAASNAGGRAVVRGISQGYSAAKGGASDIWHAEDNKIRNKALPSILAPSSCIRWMQRHQESVMAVVCGGAVHLYPVERVTRRKGDSDITGLKKYSPKTFTLPRIMAREGGSGVNQVSGCSDQGPHGFWILRPNRQNDVGPRFGRKAGGPATMMTTTDVETNPPYCPFHIDSRVSIFTFDDTARSPDSSIATHVRRWLYRGHGHDELDPWVFGEPLPPSTRVNGKTHSILDEDDPDLDGLNDQMESKLTIQPIGGEHGGEEQIRINTRRRKGHKDPDTAFEILDDEHDLI